MWEQDRALLGAGPARAHGAGARGHQRLPWATVAVGALPWHTAAEGRDGAGGKAGLCAARAERWPWLCSPDTTARARGSCWPVPAPVCQKGPCLSMHTIFSPQAPNFSPASQPFSPTSVTSSLGAGTGNESSFPPG